MSDKRISGTSSPFRGSEGGELHSIKRLTPEDINWKLRDGRKMLRHYLVGELLGEGSYGKVKEVLDTKTKKRYAVKILTKKKLRNIPGGEETVLHEIEVMKKINHKHCTQFVDYWVDEDKEKSYLVLEYVGGGSLHELLQRQQGGHYSHRCLPERQARKIFRQLIKALEYLHSVGIVHRDVKPDNIMLTTSGNVKLSDFGVAKILNSDSDDEHCEDLNSPQQEKPHSLFNSMPQLSLPSTPSSTTSSHSSHSAHQERHCGSPAFQPPEVVSGTTHFSGPTMDVWAAGVVLYCMVFGRYPFEDHDTPSSSGSHQHQHGSINFKALFDHIAACSYTIPEEADPVLASFIKGILVAEPEKRLTIDQIKTHPWMTKKLKKEESVPVQVPLSAFKSNQCKNSRNSCIIS